METPFLKLPKPLLCSPYREYLSAEAILLYTILADRQELSIKNGLFKDGKPYVYMTIEQTMDIIGCSKPTAVNLFKQLEKVQLIRRQKRKNSASIIFVQEVKNLNVQEIYHKSTVSQPAPVKEFHPGSKNLELGAVKESDSINTEFNETELNDTDMCDLVTKSVCDIFNQHKKAVNSKGRTRPGKYPHWTIEAILNAGFTPTEIIEAAKSFNYWYQISDHFKRLETHRTR